MDLKTSYQHQVRAYLQKFEQIQEPVVVTEYDGKDNLSLFGIAQRLINDFNDSGITRIALIPEQYLILSTEEALDAADIVENAKRHWNSLIHNISTHRPHKKAYLPEVRTRE